MTKLELGVYLVIFGKVIVIFNLVNVPIGVTIIACVAMGWFLGISYIEHLTRKRKNHYHMQKGEREE